MASGAARAVADKRRRERVLKFILFEGIDARLVGIVCNVLVGRIK